MLIGSTEDDIYTVRTVLPIPNRARDRKARFAVRRSDLAVLVGNAAANVIGVVHSHIDGTLHPSEDDLACIPENMIGAVWCNGGFGSWYAKSRLLHPRLVHRELEQAAQLA